MHLNRRAFIAASLTGAGALALGASVSLGQTTRSADPFQLVPLGKTGLKVSLIGCGTGMNGGNRQTNQTRMGKEKFEALLKAAYDRGIRLFDMADMYGTHPYVARALRGLPREKLTYVSKMWVLRGGIPEPERPDANVLVDRFRKELDTDYIDLVLIHCMTDPAWPENQKRYMDQLADLKAKGIIKAHGVSIHSLPGLEAAAECAWVDSVHARINPYGVAMDAAPDKVVPVLRKLHDAGKGVVGMKIIGAGKFAADPAKKNESVRYVMGLGCVDTMIVGFEKAEQIDDFAMLVSNALA